ANVSFLAVIYIETLSIGGEGQPVGLGQIPCEQAYFAIRIETIHSLERNLLLLSLHQVQSRIGEIDRAVRADDHIVGAIEAFPLIAVGQNFVKSVGLDLDDGAQNAGTVEKMMLKVIGISVGVAKREDFLLAADRKSTRLNSSHVKISYAVFCLKKKKV